MKSKYRPRVIKKAVSFDSPAASIMFGPPYNTRNYGKVSRFSPNVISTHQDTILYYSNKRHPKQKDRTIILNHGAFVTPESLFDLAEALAKRGYHVVVPCVPAHGFQGVPRESVDEMADIMESFLKALREKRQACDEIYYYGWSMGGSIAIKLALKNTQWIKGIILGNSSFKWDTIPDIPPDIFPIVFKNLFESELSPNLTTAQRQRYIRFLEKIQAPVQTSMADIEAIQAFNVIDELRKIESRTLIISGERDSVAPVCNQYILKDHIHNSVIKIIKDEGHCLPIDNPQLVAESIDEFIQSFKNNSVS